MKRKYLYSIPIPQGHGFFPFSIPPTELNPAIMARIPSPSGEKLLLLREEGLNVMRQQVLEIWTKAAECLTQRVVIPNTLHGKILHQPHGLGSLSWNTDETAVVYCAERNPPDTASFFDSDKEMRGYQNVLGYGQEERWGEKYTSMTGLLDLYLLHVGRGVITKIENVPPATSDDGTLRGFVLGQPSFSPCGTHVVYTAWDAGGGGDMARRLGMVYCYNRPSKIFASPIQKRLLQMESTSSTTNTSPSTPANTVSTAVRLTLLTPSLHDGSFVCLTESSRLSRSPRFSPPKNNISRLCYLASDEGFDTHNGAVSLKTMNWDMKNCKPILDSKRVLVESALDPQVIKEEDTTHVANLCFPGLFLQELPLYCCTKDFIYTTTQWGSVEKVVRVALDDGKVSLVNVDIIRTSGQSTESLASQQLLCIDGDGGAVIAESAPNRPAIVGYVSSKSLDRPNVSRKLEGTLVSEMGPITSSSFSSTAERSVLRLLNYNYEVFLMTRRPPEVSLAETTPSPVQWVFLKPLAQQGTLPLIVIPHGGPHSCTPTTYMPAYAFLCASGYAILHVNYRGSTGFGQRAVESLPGNIGDIDVKDIIHAVETVCSAGWVNPNRVGICGGSHGGFLAAHCIGQYPTTFRAAAMRNPVTNIATMTTSTDIPDWCYVESLGCGYYNPRKFRAATSEELQIMWKASPIRYSDKVVVPTLIALGMADKRVPPSQGLEFYYTLRSNGVKTKLLQYIEDDHAIDGVKSEADLWLNVKRWFDENL
jgi:acylaminoacyl-peptidase